MSAHVEIAGPVAYLPGSESAVFFSKENNTNAGAYVSNPSGTVPVIKKLQNELNIAFWGEDNRFPQNISNQMSYCGIGKAGLDWKARALYGGGIVPGKITGIDDKNNEIFTPLDRTEYKDVYDFIGTRSFMRFMLEYLQDWTWFSNCFPEIIFSKDCKTITNLVHQESCDCRFEQMNDSGVMENIYLSKLWGAAKDQYAQFDPNKRMRGIVENPLNLSLDDAKFIKKLPCIDMYDAVASAKGIAEKIKTSANTLKSAILPVNYPSINKTYYQVATWDGARLGGWVEIACKIPSLLKTLYNKAFSIKYHIEVPESYFPRKFGVEVWNGYTEIKRNESRKALLTEMDEFLSGDKNAFKTFVSFFEMTPHDHVEYGRIKLTVIEDKNTLDKEFMTSSAADLQILIAMQVNPTIFGAGTIGTGSQRSGGSDIRESFLVHSAQLQLERNVLLEPLYLVRDFNEWGDDIIFRVRDTVLTTLDTGAGTKKVVS